MLLIDLHLFALNCNESFRIVVDEKEKRAKLCCLTLSILVFYVKCFIINLLGPPDAYSNRAELHPELRMQRYGFFCICKYSLYFFTLKVHLFMQGIDETNKSIPYIQRETYWCVF